MKSFCKFFLAAVAFAMVAMPVITAKNGKTFGYTNPVIPGFHPDPSVCRVGNDYYLVTSTFQYFPGVPIFHSTDLVNWTQIGNVLDRESQLPLGHANASSGIYAPTIRYNDGIYYMVTTLVNDGVHPRDNFFVTATDPAGPWSEPVHLEGGNIDPSLYFEDGKCYLNSNPDGIWLCEIDPTTGKQLTEPRKIWSGTGGRFPEAPHIYKVDGWYYMMIAEGGTEMGHSITVARSRDIYGPYESNPDNPILCHQREAAEWNPIQGTGHGDLIQDQNGNWWILFLGFRPQVNGMHLTGRETYLAPVTWKNGWPVVNGGRPVEINMDVATLPQSEPANRDVDIDFTSTGKLPLGWYHLRNPHEEKYSFTTDGLMLYPGASLSSLESPTFIGRPQEDIDFTATTTLTIPKESKGIKAGLTVYMDAPSHYQIYVKDDPKGNTTVNVSYDLYALHQVVGTATLQTAKEKKNAYSLPVEVTLKVEGQSDMYTFFYSLDGGKTFNPLGSMNARYLSTEANGGFTGAMIGLFAEPNLTPVQRDRSIAGISIPSKTKDNPDETGGAAVFRSFTYRPQ